MSIPYITHIVIFEKGLGRHVLIKSADATNEDWARWIGQATSGQNKSLRQQVASCWMVEPPKKVN